MDRELRKSLNDLMREFRPEWKKLSDEQIEEKVHENFMKHKLIEPLHRGSRYGWRANRPASEHILEDDDDTFTLG